MSFAYYFDITIYYLEILRFRERESMILSMGYGNETGVVLKSIFLSNSFYFS